MANNAIQKKEELEKTPLLHSIDGIDDAIVSKSNCKFCQSKHRAEAEAEYERVSNMKAVQLWLKAHGEDISYLSVRNHILSHKSKQERAIRLKEYAEGLKEWIAEEPLRRDSIKERIALFTRELAVIAAETDGLSLEERRKSMIAIDRANASITALEDIIAEMDKAKEPVSMIVTEFQNIISRKIKQTQNQETKKELMSLFDELKEKLGEMDIAREG